MVLRPSRSISVLLAVVLLGGPSSALAQAEPASPQAEISAGDAARRAKDYAGALAHYQSSQQAKPSWRAEMGVADALYLLSRLGESYETYTDVQKTYAGRLGTVEKNLLAARLKELAAKTGWLSLRASEVGAQVDVDGKTLGQTPVPALVRFAVGTHTVHVAKAGFNAFDGKAEIVPDGKAVVDAALTPVATQGHVVVRATGPDPLRVTVDGVDVGATPWEGDLPPGTHKIGGRSSSATADEQSVDVTAGSRSSVELVATGTAAHVQIRTSDGKGVIYVDGVVKGEGSFAGDVPAGAHTLVVTRDGYERYEKPLSLSARQTWAETVTLSQTPATVAGTGEVERPYQGLYGGFGLAGALGVGGMGTELETNCSTLGAATCNTPNTAGGAAFGYLGYTWNPVGFELMLGAMVDEAQQTATFAASQSTSASSSLLPAATPARTETFTFLRAGGIAALRVRAAFQTSLLRGTIAAGPGLAYRQMMMQRQAVASDNSGRSDTYVPSAVAYVSPGIDVEAALHVRLSPTVAVAIGAMLWADNASLAGTNSAPPSTVRMLSTSSGANPVPIPTPGYDLATGSQVYIGPFLGMQFGP